MESINKDELTQIVFELMTISSVHAEFVIQSIDEFSKNILVNQKELRKSMKGTCMNPDLWIKIAMEWQSKI